jgi:hypothetical protein
VIKGTSESQMSDTRREVIYGVIKVASKREVEEGGREVINWLINSRSQTKVSESRRESFNSKPTVLDGIIIPIHSKMCESGRE